MDDNQSRNQSSYGRHAASSNDQGAASRDASYYNDASRYVRQASGRSSYAQQLYEQQQELYAQEHQIPESARQESPRQYSHAAYNRPATTYVPAGSGGGRVSPIKGILVFLLILLLVVAVVYAAGGLYFANRFYPNTYIGAVDVSFMTVEEAQAAVEDAVDDYTLSLSGQGFSLSVAASDASLSVDAEELVEDMASQKDSWAWPAEILEDHVAGDALFEAMDTATFVETVRAAVESFNSTVKGPTDASIAYDETSGQFVVTEEAVGETLDVDAVIALASEALANLNEYASVTSAALEQPSVTSDDEALVAAVASANTMLSAELSLTLGGTVVATLSGADVAEWIVLDDDLSVTIDDDELTAWAEKLAEACNTVGTTRTYTRADGKEVEVSGGTWGWEINVSTLVASIKANMKAGNTGTVVIPCSSSAEVFTSVGEQDWGTRYIDVDLTEQHVYFYDENGELIWESDCVTGDPSSDDTATPEGVYYVIMKESPSVLVGYDDDGEVDYETDVTYWMPFVGNSVGFHDATWQSAFGGTRYADGYGSHGCVNLPYDAAEELYSLIQVGDVVVVHW